MALECEITGGNSLGCKGLMGGIQYFWLTNWENVTQPLTVVNNVVTGMTMASGSPAHVWYKWFVNRNTSDFAAPIKSSVENATTTYEHTVNLQFSDMTAATNAQVQLVGVSRVMAIAVDFNGKAYLIGRVNGLDVTGGGMESGKKGDDFRGWKITLSGSEPAAPIEFNTALIVAPDFQVA
jgi:hypothetical protein